MFRRFPMITMLSLLVCFLSWNGALSEKEGQIVINAEKPFITFGANEDIRMAKVGEEFKILSQKIDLISDAVKINDKHLNQAPANRILMDFTGFLIDFDEILWELDGF